MKTKIVIGMLGVAAVLVWTGMAGAQTAPPTPKLQLPSGETVWNIEGLWDVVTENYGEWARYGTFSSTHLIRQTGNAFCAIRTKDNPPPSVGRADSASLFGELEKNGFKSIYLIDGTGRPWPAKGQISEDGNKITVDEGTKQRTTMTRRN